MKPTVVMLPGAGGRRALLAEVAARLPGRTVTVCGYPGLDGVAAAPELSTLDDLMQRLLAGLPERFDLVAKSMGSVLALRLVLAAPQRVRRLVLLATTGGLDVAAEGAAEWREAFVRAYPEAPRWFVDDRSDVEAELGRVQQPTLLLFGEADELAPVAVGRRLLAGLPRARLEVLAAATHDLEGEQPDLVAALIEAHLEGA
ncbi:MAG: alpha/beta fold hydrolase [Deltaproteobacteria bacterium]|nr:alpha/beta fold hydrolase [Deltaproteobacteria bacterium]